nr:bifunctional metallophosphatase/5'-nucleotidase [Afipia sp.]
MTQIHNLTVIQTNDTHGYLESHPELVWSGSEASYPTLGGYARIASLLNAARRENPDGVLVFDNGDTFHGTYPAVISRGEALIPLVNALKIDAMTAHWEFAWGPAHFRKLVDRLDYPMLAINCYDKATGDRAFPATVVLERAGLRLGVIGIAATIIDKSMPPHFSEGLRFTFGLDELPAEIDRLKLGESVNLIVVLSYLGFPQDVKLAASVKGIDVLLSGHTHNRLERAARIGNTIIIQSGCHGSFIGRLDLKVAGNRIINAQHRLIPVEDSIEPDHAMQRLVDEVIRPHRSHAGRDRRQYGYRIAPRHDPSAPMDDLLLAAVAKAGGTDIAFSNGGRYGAPIPPGPVTINDLWSIIPTNPPISIVNLTGAEIQEMMEESLERTFSANPFGQMGGYLKRFSGLTIYGKLENPPGHRIEHIFAAGAGLVAGARPLHA